jgi:hypothetical protein
LRIENNKQCSFLNIQISKQLNIFKSIVQILNKNG